MSTKALPRIPSLTAIALLIGIVVIFLVGFPYAAPANASGLITISSEEVLDVQFISASTNDQGAGIDPGQEIDLGQCSATFNDSQVDIRIDNGYPGYQCILSVSLKNLSSAEIRYQNVAVFIPEEIVVTLPDLQPGAVLQPETELPLEFGFRIQQNTTETSQYNFSIQLIFQDLIE